MQGDNNTIMIFLCFLDVSYKKRVVPMQIVHYSLLISDV